VIALINQRVVRPWKFPPCRTALEKWSSRVHVAIKIAKVGEGLYSAELTVPDMPSVTAKWSTPEPMGVDRLIKELTKRGAHQIDIGDAFYEADPNWLSK
jgi:hypothetical protein